MTDDRILAIENRLSAITKKSNESFKEAFKRTTQDYIDQVQTLQHTTNELMARVHQLEAKQNDDATLTKKAFIKIGRDKGWL